MILPTVSDDEAKKSHGNNIKTLSLPSGKPYLRIVPQPTNV